MTPTLPNEMELLQKMIAGDAEAFRKLYEFYQGRIFIFAYRFTKSKDVAEEVVQEAFIKLWTKREHINIEKNIASYMISTTKNLILDRLKKAALDKKVQEKILSNMQALRSTSFDELVRKELERLHQQAVDMLSPQRKAVYLLSREEELTYEEIAIKLNISRNTVRNHMAEALRTIRDHISGNSDLGCLVLAMILSELQ